jgi:peptide/nickel transport system ATP-binding protein
VTAPRETPAAPWAPGAGTVATPLLSVRGLTVAMRTDTSEATVARDVDLDIAPGEAVGLVGESGSGKTSTLRAVLRLLPAAGRIVSGTVTFDGQDLTRAGRSQLQRVRGARIGVVWQDSLTSLDPVMRVGEQIAETARAHLRLSRDVARRRACELMSQVELPDPEMLYRCYPHQLSGGQRQRIVIACAIAASPSLLLADEPTTALDVTVQDQILALLSQLRAELGLALLLVTHDLAVVGNTCERVAVMYAGRIVETGSAAEVFARPRHHYTAGLLRAMPSVDRPGLLPRGIPGSPASEAARSGCAFAPRCPRADEVCLAETPALTGLGGHSAACHHPLVPARATSD